MDNIRYENDHAKTIDLTSIESNKNAIASRVFKFVHLSGCCLAVCFFLVLIGNLLS